jgi:hypothetical protein
MLFILAIDPLPRLIELAAHTGLLHPISPREASLRCSLYAHDATVFTNPDRNELRHISQILNIFGNCSGLKVNLNKTSIRCDKTTISQNKPATSNQSTILFSEKISTSHQPNKQSKLTNMPILDIQKQQKNKSTTRSIELHIITKVKLSNSGLCTVSRVGENTTRSIEGWTTMFTSWNVICAKVCHFSCKYK